MQTLLLFIAYCTKAKHHVDDEHEAVRFINKKVANSRAWFMNVDPDDVEENCSGVQGSNGMHEFRCVYSLHCSSSLITNLLFHSFFTGVGEVLVRPYLCFCANCLLGLFSKCSDAQYVGRFVRRTMKSKGTRSVKSRHVSQRRARDEEGVFEVERITGRKYVFLAGIIA